MGRLFLTILLAIGIVSWPTDQSPAASSCPALPQSTFIGALTSMLGGDSGTSNRLRDAGDPVKLLNDTQHQKVLQWMRKELVERDKAFAKTRDKSAAQKKAEDLKRRIFTRDRMERDSSVVAGRIFDKRPDDRRKIATGEGKSLGQLVDEEIKRAKPSLPDKYKAKYRKAVYAAMAADPAKMGEVAGALSAGDYQTVVDQAADWGAQGFGTIVGDVLTEKSLGGAKVVWDRAVKHADAAKRVILALKKGGSGDEAMKIIREELKKEVKSQSRAFMKAAVNFAFNASKYDRKLGGAATIGDFIPSGTVRNLVAPKLSALTPGDLYLKLIDSELALIKWSDDFLRTKWSGGDGACVAKYKKEYERTGNVADAYEEYDLCSSTAKYSAMFKFGVQAQEMGLDKAAALKEFLEANRRGLRGSATPLEWIEAKAERIAAQRKAAGRAIESQLMAMHADLSGMARGIGAQTDDRLSELAGSVLDDKQWDRIAAQLRDLEKKLDETLAAIDGDLKIVASDSDRIANFCGRYDRQKAIARQAMDDGRILSTRATRLRARLGFIDTISCGQPESESDGNGGAAKSAALAATVDKDQAALRAAINSVCSAPEEIRKAENKADGRTRLDAALASAREAKAIARRLTASAGEIASLKSSGNAINTAQAAEAAAARAKTQSEIATAKSEIEAIAGGFGSAQERFTVAHNAMRDAQQHISDSLIPLENIIANVKACLRPLASSPAGERPRAILASLLAKSTNNVGCNAVIQESWNERDLDPPRADGAPSNSAPWRSRSLSLLPTPDALRTMVADIDAKCPAGAAQSSPSAATTLSKQADPDAIRAEASEALRRMERCTSEAIVAYSDAWLKPKITVSNLTCQPQQNADVLAKLRNDGSDAAKDQIAKLEPIAAAVSKARGAYANARQAYNAGHLDEARTSLGSAKAALAVVGGSVDCSDLAGKIDGEMSKVDLLDGILSEVNGAIGRCDTAEISRLKERHASVSHLMLSSLFSKATAITDAKAAFERAKASYTAGHLDAAERATRSALTGLGNAPCADVRETLNVALGRIDRLRTAIDNANQAIVACKVSSIERWQAALAKASNPAAAGVKQRLKHAHGICQDRERNEKIAGMDKRCKEMLGVNSHIDRARAMSSSPLCLCNNGYVMDAAKSICVQRPKTVADGHPACKKTFGRRAYALAVNPNGTYKCGCRGGYVIRNKQCSRPVVADGHSACKKTFGRKAYSLAVNRNGTFKCGCSGGYVIRNKRCSRQTFADGHRACRAQFGGRSRATRYAGNGRWNCYIPGQNRTVTRQQPNVTAQDIARGAAIIGGIINGMQRNGGERHPVSPRITPRRPTGHTHKTRPVPSRSQPPPRCVVNGFVNHTDKRCSRYW